MTNAELAQIFAEAIAEHILAERLEQPTKKAPAPVIKLKPKKVKRPTAA